MMRNMITRARIVVHVAIYRRLQIGRDGHLDQSEAYDISYFVRKYRPRLLSFSASNQHILTPIALISSCYDDFKK